MKANNMKDTLFFEDEYDLKGHERSHKANLSKFYQHIHLSTDFDKKFVEY